MQVFEGKTVQAEKLPVAGATQKRLYFLVKWDVKDWFQLEVKQNNDKEKEKLQRQGSLVVFVQKV